MRRFSYILAAIVLAACSTTSHLPEGETLYIGIDDLNVEGRLGTPAEESAMTEVLAALDYPPNGSFMGSSSARSPFQLGLWMYNSLVDRQTSGVNKWLFKSFATPPVTISHVAPDTRSKVASNLLQNYGYFRGRVDYRIVERRNPKKQKISYDIRLGQPYLFDSIHYAFSATQDSIVKANAPAALIRRGDQFSTLSLTNEKARLSADFRNNGFYYYRPDFIRYFADTIMTPYRVNLLVNPDPDTPPIALRQYHVGKISAYIRQTSPIRTANAQASPNRSSGRRGVEYSDSMEMRSVKIAWQGDRVPLAPRVLFKNFRFRRRQLYNQSLVDQTLANLHSMNIFSSARLTFTPRDSIQLAIPRAGRLSPSDQQGDLVNWWFPDTLDVRLDLTMDRLMDLEVDFGITQKSNSQVGPNLGLTLSRRNAFRHGETLSVGLRGSYEWQTQKPAGETQRIDSYELGADVSLSYPWIAFPWLNREFRRHPASTQFSVSTGVLNRANYYRLMSFSAEATYKFQTGSSWSHQLTPLTVTYNKMQHTTPRFDAIVDQNSALYVSLRDVFIPAQQYVLTYYRPSSARHPHSFSFEGVVKQSGNLLNVTNTLLGFDYFQKDKKLLRTPYSQFLKFLLTFKHTYRISEKSSLATRLQMGAIWTYGNSSVAPYSELFYVGGANSIRAFAVRDIGPGTYRDTSGRGTYLDQAGDIKLEFNAEYRFPLAGTLQGALFVDAGNVWLMHGDDSHPGGRLDSSPFLRSLALGTGFGLRYDLEFLVLRLDLGVGLHAPYDTGKSSYFNIPKFTDGLGLHFAVGYPF